MSSEYLSIRFPGLGITLRAKLLWEENPKVCELLLDNLPIETIYSHTMASGQGMYAPARIVGYVKAKQVLLTDLPHGTLTLSTGDYKALGMFYGEITEPLPGWPPVARVVEEDMPDLLRVGREVWIATYMTHDPVRVIFEATS